MSKENFMFYFLLKEKAGKENFMTYFFCKRSKQENFMNHFFRKRSKQENFTTYFFRKRKQEEKRSAVGAPLFGWSNFKNIRKGLDFQLLEDAMIKTKAENRRKF